MTRDPWGGRTGTGRISLTGLRSLLCSLPQPLGFRNARGELELGPEEVAPPPTLVLIGHAASLTPY